MGKRSRDEIEIPIALGREAMKVIFAFFKYNPSDAASMLYSKLGPTAARELWEALGKILDDEAGLRNRRRVAGVCPAAVHWFFRAPRCQRRGKKTLTSVLRGTPAKWRRGSLENECFGFARVCRPQVKPQFWVVLEIDTATLPFCRTVPTCHLLIAFPIHLIICQHRFHI